MPTHEEDDRFWVDWHRLTRAEQLAFLGAVAKLVYDLRSGQIRKGLRVKRLKRSVDRLEMTWPPDGRAVFKYGPEIRPGERHVI
jgi:hypothetical protein